mgnify:CR=1 FL=1
MTARRSTLYDALQRAPLILTAKDLAALKSLAAKCRSRSNRWAREYIAELVAARELAVEAKRNHRKCIPAWTP